MSGTDRANPAVVIGIHTMQGLQTARLLHRVGVEVHGISIEPGHPFNRTRHCVDVVTCGDGDGELLEALVDIGSRLDHKAVLVPALDWGVKQVSDARDELDKWYLYRLPPADVVDMLMDKTSFQAHAERVGLPVPESRILLSRADAEAAADSMMFPCVLKPGTRSSEWSANTSAKAFQLDDGAELLAIYDEVAPWVDSLIIQQWIVGPEDNLFSVNGYFDEAGNSLATFVARKIRQWPVRTGQSSMGVECRNDKALDLYHRLFSSIPYAGLAYLEVKQDSRSGRHYLVEPNIGRPTGRSAIAEAGGVQLIDTMYCDITAQPLPEARTQTYGNAKWIHLRRDLMASATMMKDRELGPRQWWRSVRGPKFYAIWDPSDPGPFAGEIIRVSKLGLRSLVSKWWPRGSQQ